MPTGSTRARWVSGRRAGRLVRTAGACLAAAAVFLLSAAGPASAEFAYVSVWWSNAVVPVDLSTGEAASPIPVGGAPEGITISPDGDTALVPNFQSHEVTPIDLRTRTVGPPIEVEHPWEVAITPDGGSAYVTSTSTESVLPIDLAAGTTGTPIAVGESPSAIAITPDGESAYVADYSNGSVTAIDLATGTPAANIPVGDNPIAIAIAPDGGTAYVLNRTVGEIVPIDLDDNLPGVSISLGGPAYAIAIAPDGETAYVAMEGDDSILPIELPAGAVGAPIAVGKTPAAIAIAPDGETAYVANANSDYITRIDLASGATAPIPVGTRPIGIAIPPLQSPHASFTAAVAPAGQPTRFDASASTAGDATPAAYEWEFGDGASLTTRTPVVQHTYARSGAHTATLSVRNACAPGAIFTGPISFTGQTAFCNGPTTDRASHQVAIPAVPPAARCPRLVATPRGYTPATRVKGGQVPGVRARILVNAPVKLQVKATLAFRRKHSSRRIALGRHTLDNSGARNLRLPLPRDLRRRLPLGTRVKLTLTITADAGCGAKQSSRQTIRTRVVKVLVPRSGVPAAHQG